MTDDTHSFTLFAGTTQTISNVKVKNFYGDFTYSGQTTVFDDITVDDTFMCVRIFHGNLTINAGQTFDPPRRTRGFFVFVKGNLTNNGTISMTARGASASPPSADLQIWGNAVVPRLGQTGGAGAVALQTTTSTPAYDAGKQPSAASNRATGGGGSGGANFNSTTTITANHKATSGAGGQGTAWSGGAGGGGISIFAGSGGSALLNLTAPSGSSTGSTGGGGVIGMTAGNRSAGGGAGNPGGFGRRATGSNAAPGPTFTASDGSVGTGGLLMIACLGTFTSTGANSVVSRGSDGGPPDNTTSYAAAGGGASGGGSINVVYGSANVGGSTFNASGGTTLVPAGEVIIRGGIGGTGSVSASTFTTDNVSLPRRTLVNVGGTYYYRDFSIAVGQPNDWRIAGSAGSTTPFEQYGMFDAEVFALDKTAIADIPGINQTSVRFEVYQP